MKRHQQIMAQGEKVYTTYPQHRGYPYCCRAFADDSSSLAPVYILVEQRFITGHDDSAEFVELINEDEKIIRSWKFEGLEPKRFENPDLYDDDCLVYYLKETLRLRVVQKTWGRNVGEV